MNIVHEHWLVLVGIYTSLVRFTDHFNSTSWSIAYCLALKWFFMNWGCAHRYTCFSILSSSHTLVHLEFTAHHELTPESFHNLHRDFFHVDNCQVGHSSFTNIRELG